MFGRTIMSKAGVEGYENITDRNIEDYLSPDVVFLVDPDKHYSPHSTGAMTILFISQARERVGNFSRVNVAALYMPPWKEPELRDCVERIYPYAKTYFKSQFDMWGGSIRFMTAPCDEISEKSHMKNLNEFLGSRYLIDVVNEASEYVYQKEELTAYQWIVHRMPIQNGVTDYTECICDYPSQYIALQIARRVHCLKVDWKIIGDPVLLGRAYEHHVLDTLFKVSQDEHLPVLAYRVGGRQKRGFRVPAVKSHRVFSNKDIIDSGSLVKGALYISVEPNKPGMDFVMPPWIFQTTISRVHSAKRLDLIISQFPSTKEWKICFIVLSVRHDEFQTPDLSLYPRIKEKFKLPWDFGR